MLSFLPKNKRKKYPQNSIFSFIKIYFLFFFLVGCSQSIYLIKTPNLYLEGSQTLFKNVPKLFQNNKVELIYVTDRNRLNSSKESTTLEYGIQRSKRVDFGNTTIQIGDSQLDWQTLEKESLKEKRALKLPLKIVQREKFGEFPPTPLALNTHVKGLKKDIIGNPHYVLGFRKMHQLLEKKLALSPKKEVYLFVHGFNNSLDYASFTMAQLWHYLGRVGVPVVYSWPAGNPGLLGYVADRESADFTIFHLKMFLVALAECQKIEKLHIIAHSLGSHVITTALRELNLSFRDTERDLGKYLKLGNLILAAPDIDGDVVGQRIIAEKVHLIPDRLTIYLSSEDNALNLSSWINSSIKRLGSVQFSDLLPFQKESLKKLSQKLQFISTPPAKDFIGHDYFISNPAVSSDIIKLLRFNISPGKERPLKSYQNVFWEIQEDYLLGSPED